MSSSRYFNTIRYLKPIQIRYQIYYRVRKKWRQLFNIKYPLSNPCNSSPLTFSRWIEKPASYFDNSFTFLNQTKTYPDGDIHWNENKFGLLWAYNLNYMDYLLKPGLTYEEGIRLIRDFIKQLPANKIGLEPYPISLRGINWIKFLSQNQIKEEETDNSLYAQYKILLDNLEYHLLGNHLLENGFSLLYGAFYFNDFEFYTKAKQIIEKELEEQILDDGGHFELTPMYHQIILERLLDCINLLQNNERFEDQKQLLNHLKEKAGIMLHWLQNMTFRNGDIPLFNDSANDIASSTTQLLDYAERLNLYSKLQTPNSKLSSSGYRRYNGEKYECIVDVGPIGPDYIPGHAHADMLSFVLQVDGQPVIVDMGISTYEKNERRHLERSTSSHNTVVINNKNQSDVWGGFRAGKRARIQISKEGPDYLEAQHDGYIPVYHLRKFRFTPKSLHIQDNLIGRTTTAKAFLYFDRNVAVELKKNTLYLKEKNKIEIRNADNIKITTYNQPLGFNRFEKAKKLEVKFIDELTLSFYFK